MKALNVIMVIMLALGLSVTVSFAKGGNHNKSRVNESSKQTESASWTIKEANSNSVTLQGKDETKQLKVSTFTEIIIDGTSKKATDITAGMKVLSFIEGGDGTSVSRLVLESAKTTNSSNKSTGKRK